MVEPSLTAYLHGEHRAPQVNATRHQLQRNADTRSRFWLMCSARKSGRQAREGRRELPRSTARISQGAGMPPPLSDWLSWPFWSHTGPCTRGIWKSSTSAEGDGRLPAQWSSQQGCFGETAPSSQGHFHCNVIKILGLWYRLILYMGTECSKEEH